jgi:hypothetical protein
MHYPLCTRHAPVARPRGSSNGDGGCQKKRWERACITNRVNCSPNAAEGRSARARSATRIVRVREERRKVVEVNKKSHGEPWPSYALNLCTFETQPMKFLGTGTVATHPELIVNTSRQYGQEQARALATQRRKEGKRSEPSNPSQPSSIRL